MNRIHDIQRFLQDFDTLDPNLKELLSWSKAHYQNELRQEYLRLAKHPYPSDLLTTV
mgnify:CR=1 FL=1